MNTLNLSRLLGIGFNNKMDSALSTEMPLLSISSERLNWKNQNLGKLFVDTERSAYGVSFKQLSLKSRDHELEMTADWVNKYKQSYTHVQGRLWSPDIGYSLSMLGFNSTILESEGDVEFSGNWQGSPYQFSLGSVDGKVSLDLKKGRISSIEPGFGRVLGLIAMEQWIKRLTLDFGDIYKRGLALNSISGDLEVNQGKADTYNLLVNSVPAKIMITGRANLIEQSLDHEATVIPKSSDALPIAGKIVSFLAGGITQALTDNYKEGYFFGSKYKITGSWNDIKVTALHKQDGILKKTWTGLTDFSWMKLKKE